MGRGTYGHGAEGIDHAVARTVFQALDGTARTAILELALPAP
ncbi:hypothetical protein SAMN04488078_100898 [Antarctobacter heliothermus]|uniref:Uncharacterized protein n=1 Tax=Antarctobacter heliothermus TaxID=74033 RepID=A0A239CXX1_9RHOB|nr:hypothetical protein SAMN04488078_100898 [Antarctobacter heliothermus]